MKIEITPTLQNLTNGVATTELKLIVNLSLIEELIKRYDLLLKVNLTVNSEAYEEMVYEYAHIYRNLTTTNLQIDAMVVGHITSVNQIIPKAQATFVRKLGGND